MKLLVITSLLVFSALTCTILSEGAGQDKEKKQSKGKKQETRKKKEGSAVTNSAATTTGSKLTPEEVQNLMTLHTNIRAEVKAGPLTWSKEIAAYAQKWADHLGATKCDLAHRPSSGEWKQMYGENLFVGSAKFFTVADAVKLWENEKKNYKGQAISSGSANSGHYTQVVWKKTKQVGCGKAVCKDNLIVVCNYDPSGNVAGQLPY
ncbi:MAG: CAP domain-containing protein [Acidobacteria bacterium]|nr:CAP domain-containing protein [Acidobacteriota bacterium]